MALDGDDMKKLDRAIVRPLVELVGAVQDSVGRLETAVGAVGAAVGASNERLDGVNTRLDTLTALELENREISQRMLSFAESSLRVQEQMRDQKIQREVDLEIRIRNLEAWRAEVDKKH